jgi:hypothetical protein
MMSKLQLGPESNPAKLFTPILESIKAMKKTGKTYKRVARYKCLGDIYHQGKSFGESGRMLIESDNKSLFIPGIINICLSAEIFLKSINATTSNIEDEMENDGRTIYQGRDESMEISPGGKGHKLSQLFSNLPPEAQDEIGNLAAKEGYPGDIFDGLKQYDDTFVEWRYIYEKRTPEALSTHPLFPIVNAINSYCERNLNEVFECRSDEFATPPSSKYG